MQGIAPSRLCLGRRWSCMLGRRPGARVMVARRKVLQGLAATGLVAMDGRSGHAETYPTRPVRVIVTTGPGGQGDITARLVAAKLTESLGQSFYVENIGGGGGNIAMGTAARAA